MKVNKVLKAACAVLTVLLIFGLFQFVFFHGTLRQAKEEYDETAQQMEQAIRENERDAITGMLQYDVYKAALNSKVHAMSTDEELVHINVGFGSLDRGLKYVNDTYGHLNGRPTIQNFAELLKEEFPEEEGWILCHRGGSGFLVCGKAKAGEFTEEKLLGYYNDLKAKWHDKTYVVPTGNGKIDGMALLFLADVAPECGTSFGELRDELVYKKLSLRDQTNCGYVIETSPGHFISNVEINEEAYMEE